MIVKKNKIDLEKTVISFLSNASPEEASEYIEKIDVSGWEKETQQAIDIIVECISLGESNILDSLIAKYRPASTIAKILSVFVPTHVGKQAIKDLSIEQSRIFYKKRMREIESEPIELRPELLKEISDLLSRRVEKVTGIEDDDLLIRRISRISVEELSNIKHYQTLRVGIGNLDKGGIPTGMNLIIGQPGAGKSWFMNHIVKSAWLLNNKRTVMFSLEMDFNGLKKRMIQSFSGITVEQFANGHNVDKGINLLREIDPLIVDYTQQDSSKIVATDFLVKAHQFYKEGYRVFVFDHFHEIPGSVVNDKNQQVTEQWADAFKLLRNLYDDLWIFVLVQSNKEGYKSKILTKENVSGSSALVNKCDFFLSLNRTEDPESENVSDFTQDKFIKIWVDKARRTGADKYMSFAFLKSTGEFVDAAKSELDKLTKPAQLDF